MSALVFGTYSIITGSTNVINGAVQVLSRVKKLVAPGVQHLPPKDQRKLSSIHRRLAALIQPLQLCLLWCRDKDSFVQNSVINVAELLQEVWDFLDRLHNTSPSNMSSGLPARLLNGEGLIDPASTALKFDDSFSAQLDHFIQELEFSCTNLNLCLSIVSSTASPTPMLPPSSFSPSSNPSSSTFSPSALLKASRRIQKMWGRGGDLVLIPGTQLLMLDPSMFYNSTSSPGQNNVSSSSLPAYRRHLTGTYDEKKKSSQESQNQQKSESSQAGVMFKWKKVDWSILDPSITSSSSSRGGVETVLRVSRDSKDAPFSIILESMFLNSHGANQNNTLKNGVMPNTSSSSAFNNRSVSNNNTNSSNNNSMGRASVSNPNVPISSSLHPINNNSHSNNITATTTASTTNYIHANASFNSFPTGMMDVDFPVRQPSTSNNNNINNNYLHNGSNNNIINSYTLSSFNNINNFNQNKKNNFYDPDLIVSHHPSLPNPLSNPTQHVAKASQQAANLTHQGIEFPIVSAMRMKLGCVSDLENLLCVIPPSSAAVGLDFIPQNEEEKNKKKSSSKTITGKDETSLYREEEIAQIGAEVAEISSIVHRLKKKSPEAESSNRQNINSNDNLSVADPSVLLWTVRAGDLPPSIVNLASLDANLSSQIFSKKETIKEEIQDSANVLDLLLEEDEEGGWADAGATINDAVIVTSGGKGSTMMSTEAKVGWVTSDSSGLLDDGRSIALDTLESMTGNRNNSKLIQCKIAAGSEKQMAKVAKGEEGSGKEGNEELPPPPFSSGKLSEAVDDSDGEHEDGSQKKQGNEVSPLKVQSQIISSANSTIFEQINKTNNPNKATQKISEKNENIPPTKTYRRLQDAVQFDRNDPNRPIFLCLLLTSPVDPSIQDAFQSASDPLAICLPPSPTPQLQVAAAASALNQTQSVEGDSNVSPIALSYLLRLAALDSMPPLSWRKRRLYLQQKAARQNTPVGGSIVSSGQASDVFSSKNSPSLPPLSVPIAQVPENLPISDEPLFNVPLQQSKAAQDENLMQSYLPSAAGSGVIANNSSNFGGRRSRGAEEFLTESLTGNEPPHTLASDEILAALLSDVVLPEVLKKYV
eukprot:GDKJ01011411.1.p1 GENE.GDKJ01011411.1~~GDKJ01011411.1.p1  ORF type:complete len:1102 (+),score=346.19 GDKJ01011411.1:34-3339(+)